MQTCRQAYKSLLCPKGSWHATLGIYNIMIFYPTTTCVSKKMHFLCLERSLLPAPPVTVGHLWAALAGTGEWSLGTEFIVRDTHHTGQPHSDICHNNACEQQWGWLPVFEGYWGSCCASHALFYLILTSALARSHNDFPRFIKRKWGTKKSAAYSRSCKLVWGESAFKVVKRLSSPGS